MRVSGRGVVAGGVLPAWKAQRGAGRRGHRRVEWLGRDPASSWLLEVLHGAAAPGPRLESQAGLSGVLRHETESKTSGEAPGTAAGADATHGPGSAGSGVVGGLHERCALPRDPVRTFNIIDDFNREALAIEIDTSLRASRLLRVFERLGAERGYPAMLRVDNGPEFTSNEFMAWAEVHGIQIRYIQPGKPNQNAFIERFNRTYREEVLDLYLFRSLEEVREVTYHWLIDYNEARPHDALGDVPPGEYRAQTAGTSTFQLST